MVNPLDFRMEQYPQSPEAWKRRSGESFPMQLIRSLEVSDATDFFPVRNVAGKRQYPEIPPEKSRYLCDRNKLERQTPSNNRAISHVLGNSLTHGLDRFLTVAGEKSPPTSDGLVF